MPEIRSRGFVAEILCEPTNAEEHVQYLVGARQDALIV